MHGKGSFEKSDSSHVSVGSSLEVVNVVGDKR